MRPLDEFDFRDELRLDEVHAPVRLDFVNKRVLGCGERFELLP